MIEMPASALAIKQIERMLEAAANGGQLHCIEREGGKIFYIKQNLRPDLINRVLYGKPGPGDPAPVLRLVMENASVSARAHVDARFPALLEARAARASQEKSRA